MKLLRNYIIVLSAVAIIAVVLAAMSAMGLLTKADQVVIDPADPLTVNQNETGDGDLARLLESALKNASPAEDSLISKEGTASVTLQGRTDGGVLTGAYSLHVISMINRSALLEDLQTGDYYQLSARDFSLLLSHKAFADLPERTFPEPSLSLESDDAAAWLYLTAWETEAFSYTAAGIFRSIERKGADQVQTMELTEEQASQKPRIYSSVPADAWSLTVTSGDAMSLSQSRVQEEELFFPSEPGEYTYTITAHWDLTDQRDWYGEITYVFEIRITESQAQETAPGSPEGETSGQ